MRQIRDMSIMEIDITNACEHRCSNCTRFCGHHKKPFFMDFETFKKAVDSLEGYRGLISTIGGEPLLHPEYNRFAEYLNEVHGMPKMDDGRCQAMVKDYLAFAKDQRWYEGALNKGRGNLLFTSMPMNYYDKYEAVQNTVTDLWLNDHTNPSFHQPILVSRKDLGIGDEEFEKLRDNCWLQNFWSGSITPKGAFFCEIAGTLDLLFDGPGGKKIEPGWWDKDISEFEDQFHWCDICGMALSTYSRNANDEIDDASPTLYSKLKQIQSPKLKKDQVFLFDPQKRQQQDGISIGSDMGSVTANYLPENDKRVGNAADFLKPKNISLLLSVQNDADLSDFEDKYSSYLKVSSKFIVVTFEKYRNALEKVTEKFETTTAFVTVEGNSITMGHAILSAKEMLGKQDWVMVSDSSSIIPENFVSRVSQYFLNPGYLFVVEQNDKQMMLISGVASTIKQIGYDRLLRCNELAEIHNVWGEKVCSLDERFDSYPDTNIALFRDRIWDNYLKDNDFQNALKLHLAERNLSGNKLLLLQSSFVYHTLGILKSLQEQGYEVYVVSNKKFKPYFDEVLDDEHIVFFTESHFRYEQQVAMREELKKRAEFTGAIVPFSFGPSTVKPIDDYTDTLKTAEDITGKILGIINIRREFIEPEYDIWK